MTYLTDLPCERTHGDYETARDRMVCTLRTLPGIRSIYQVGGVSAPGISDLDMYALFEDAAVCREDPRAGLSRRDRYLFLHPLFGIHRSRFRESLRFPFFHAYRLLWGVDEGMEPAPARPDVSQEVLRQIGLEFLVKSFLSIALQREMGILKVRSLLLHVHSLHYDLDYVGLTQSDLDPYLEQVRQWRSQWFRRPAGRAELRDWRDGFLDTFPRVMEPVLRNSRVSIPLRAPLSLAPGLALKPGDCLRLVRRGLRLPAWLSRLTRRYEALQYRTNRFALLCPMQRDALSPDVAARHEFIARAVAANRHALPHFLAVPYAMPIFSAAEG